MGIDFFAFTKEQVQEYDYIISNPPFSVKTKLFEKLIELERPFALLLPIAQTMETQVRQDLFKPLNIQLLHPNKRIHFYSPIEGSVKKATTFSSGYFCGGGVLPRDLVFADIDKTLMSNNDFPQCPFT
jgi:23S rRNA G2445 N2-methylase RlmL